MNICSQDDYNWQKIIKVFVYMVNSFWMSCLYISSNISQLHKPCITNPAFLGIFYFAVSNTFPKFCQYFILGMSLIYTTTNVSTDVANARIQFSWKIGHPFHLDSFPHMDVITFDISFIYVIKLRILWNTKTMTQHWYIRRLEVIFLPTNFVHILYGYLYVPS